MKIGLNDELHDNSQGSDQAIKNAGINATRNAAKSASKAASKTAGKTAAKTTAKAASKATGPISVLIDAGIEIADKSGLLDGLTKAFKGLIASILIVLLVVTSTISTSVAGLSFNLITRIDDALHPHRSEQLDENLGADDIKKEDQKYAKYISKYMIKERELLPEYIEAECKRQGVDYEASSGNIIDNTIFPEISAPGSGTTDNVRILMVDNDDDNKRVVERFEKEGCIVKTVFDKDSIDANSYDALVIPGGHNVTPSLYGEKSKGKPYTTDTNKKKDKLQIYAVKQFAAQKKPILGLCRGMQLVNVAFNGTIDQGTGKYHKEWHKVYFDKDSWAGQIYGDELKAYHYHKQQVKKLGDGFVADTWSKKGKKGFIEGMHHSTLPIYCTQWHPDVKKMGDTGQKVFKQFVKITIDDMADRGITARTSGSAPSQSKYKSSNPAIQGAIDWAVMIANDNSFTYGTAGAGVSRPYGCYFCGTNGHGKYEKTYVCMTFIGHAYAHGAQDPATLKRAKKRKMVMYSNNDNFKIGCWQKVGLMSQLTVSDLQPGDVLVHYDESNGNRKKGGRGHVSMYLGNGDMVDASGANWSASSIAIRKGKAKSYLKGKWNTQPKKNYVMRYVGNGSGSSSSFVNTPKAYKKITAIKTLTSSTGKKYTIKTASGYGAEAFAHNGDKYYITSTVRARRAMGGYVLVTNAKGAILSKSSHLSFRHGQGLAYNTKNNTLYTSTTMYTGNNRILQKISPETLTIVGKSRSAAGASGIGYDRVKQCFVSMSAGTGFTLYGKNLGQKLKTVPLKRKLDSSMSTQDICVHDGIAYMAIWDRGDGNHLDMYNLNNGDYIGTYECPYDELESPDIDENGELTLLFNGPRYPYMQFTGIKVASGGTETSGVDIEGLAKSRDLALIYCGFSIYESQLLPIQEEADADDSESGFKFWWTVIKESVKDKYRRDIKYPTTLKRMLKKAFKKGKKEKSPAFYEIVIAEPEEKNGKLVSPMIEVNPAAAEKVCEIFEMDPEAEYNTEPTTDSDKKSTRKKGKAYIVGYTNIATAIETNADTHLELLYDDTDHPSMSKGLVLPIKTMLTTVKLTVKFKDDKKGIECKPGKKSLVYASEHGTVSKVKQNDPVLGNYIEIEGNYKIIYAHLDKINVSVGEVVSRNKIIGTASKRFRFEVYEEGVPVDPEPLFIKKKFGELSSAAGGNNGTLADAAVSIALEKKTYGSDGTKLYQSLWKPLDISYPYRSCDRTVCTAVRWAGADDSFPVGPCNTQNNHMVSSNKWQKVTINKVSDLKPGDVLNNPSLHTLMYVGNEAVKRKYPNSNGNCVEGSLESPYSRARPPCVTKIIFSCHGSYVNLFGYSGKYEVFRNVKQETNSRYKNVLGGVKSSSGNIKFDSGKKGKYQKYAYSLFSKYGWSDSEFEPLKNLWDRESGWRVTAENKSSGAYGIPQSLPGKKMASEGKDWKTNYKTQIKWGLKYIDGRYGSPSKAWKHSEDTGWY